MDHESFKARDKGYFYPGLPRHDFIWYKSTDSLEELFQKLRYLPLNKDFRTTFQYQSLTYMILGYLAGEYQSSLGISFNIGCCEGTLTLTIPGQPSYELVNQGGDLFQLKGLKSFFVQFHIEDNGVSRGLTLTQPNGVFKLNRKFSM